MQKTFNGLSRTRRKRAQTNKVFWFFFSKKKILYYASQWLISARSCATG
jgi:hypothetical protein